MSPSSKALNAILSTGTPLSRQRQEGLERLTARVFVVFYGTVDSKSVRLSCLLIIWPGEKPSGASTIQPNKTFLYSISSACLYIKFGNLTYGGSQEKLKGLENVGLCVLLLDFRISPAIIACL